MTRFTLAFCAAPAILTLMASLSSKLVVVRDALKKAQHAAKEADAAVNVAEDAVGQVEQMLREVVTSDTKPRAVVRLDEGHVVIVHRNNACEYVGVIDV